MTDIYLPVDVVDITYLPVDHWGNRLISVKDDYDYKCPDAIEGVRQRPWLNGFNVGHLARVTHQGDNCLWWEQFGVVDHHYVKTYPRAGQVGEVTEIHEDGRRLTLAFKDGHKASYYHNELRRVFRDDPE